MRLFKHRNGYLNLDLVTDVMPEGNGLALYLPIVEAGGQVRHVISDREDCKRLLALLDRLADLTF